jgi:coatomer subunit delta
MEKLTCNLTKEGGLTLFELIGEVFLTVNDSSKGCCQIEIQHQKSKEIVVKPIPVLNKNLWNDKGIIAMKDPNESFVPGEQISTLKYKYTSTSVDDLPFNFTYWFNKGVLTLEVEYNSNQTRFDRLENIDFLIKYPVKEVPEIRSIENGEQLEGPNKSSLVWRVLSLDSNNSSSNISIKFSTHLMIDELFPINVSFSTKYNFYKMAVKQAVNLKDNTPLTFETKINLVTDNFKIN